MLHDIKKGAKSNTWYEDPIIVAFWMEKLWMCFKNIHKFHTTFKTLPQVGDCLLNEPSALIVQQRSIDGENMSILFTLSD
ncbi:hypothetical protein [Spirosoma sp. KNUC1025]|uniref:hypothetical protein n=1 Tax=Spirosoma sp. KNUC1025 TaxID=2894082 RepID=UPI00386A809B|nr:hypothetical protein LN737_00255 [Spirosoma sp. KNUC1025]